MELGRRDVERVVEELMEAFEDAYHERLQLEEPSPKTILLALDQSNQDDLVIGLGLEIGRRNAADVVVSGGFPDTVEEEARGYISRASQRLQEGGVNARPLWARGEESFDKILTAQSESKAEIIILPAPYFRDIESLGEDSVGTNLDVLLVRSPTPMLVVRDPTLSPEAVLGHIHLAIFDDTPLSKASAEWALFLARDSRLDVLAVVEEEFVDIMEEALASEGITEEELGKRLAGSLVPLVSTVLRNADEADVPCDVKYAMGDLVDTITRRAGRTAGMVVLRGYEAHDRPGEKVAREVILRSTVPVVIVKGAD